MRASLRSLLFSSSALALAALALSACALPGSGDGGDEATGAAEAQTVADLSHARSLEVTRFRHAGHASGEQDGASVASYRFNGFGATKVSIEVTPRDAAFAPTIVLAGPIPGDETKVVVQKRGTRAGGVKLEATLDARGAYRLLVGTQAAFAGREGDAGAYDVDFRCLANCDLPEVTLGGVLRDLEATQGDAAVKAGLTDLATAHITDPDLRAKILGQLQQLLAGAAAGGPGSIDDAPMPAVPMSLLGVAQGLFEQAPGASPSAAAAPAPAKLDVELSEIGAGCEVSRGGPAKDISPRLPGLSVSDVPDYTYDDCALARIEGLAAALNALSLGDGSVVRDGDARYTTVAELARALVDQGHTITIDNSRYYADFLGLNYKGASVRASVWIDTGLALPSGDTLKIPAPHAHHNVYVRGPRFDGQLKFYMGVDAGTSFRVQSSIPRAWSGGRVVYTLDTTTREDDVLRVLAAAGDLRKKWQAEGASMPMTGYGRLGVCTDSTAVLEYTLQKTVSLFPLVHPKRDPAAATDAIDAALAALPSDSSGFDREDALRRIGQTIPFASPDDVPFAAFRAEWAQLR
jgi:hypothetical protein